MIPVGTKSILFGVHSMFFHPWNVGYAWRRIYGKWPNFFEWCAVICHDAAYFSKTSIDGEDGKKHPFGGARIAGKMAYCLAKLQGHSEPRKVQVEMYYLSLLHSRSMAKRLNREPSRLCAPDKLCVLYEYRWFYLLRARLSGEIKEFKTNAVCNGHISEGATDKEWFNDYRSRVEREFL